MRQKSRNPLLISFYVGIALLALILLLAVFATIGFFFFPYAFSPDKSFFLWLLVPLAILAIYAVVFLVVALAAGTALQYWKPRS